MRLIFLFREFKNIILKLPKVPKKIQEILNLISDQRLKKIIKVKDNENNKIFKIYDFGYLTRYRATTFFNKEPETISWIKSFKKGEIFLDVGANIGIYSLYAASKGINTISIEPDSLNNALLNLNINANFFGDKVLTYALAFHEKQKYSTLNIKQIEWGGALNSFDNCKDQFNKLYSPNYRQGVFGDTIDNFLKNLEKSINHIKIDVDGNEYLVLKGAQKTLNTKSLKTILIELDNNHPNYNKCINLIISNGFMRTNKFNKNRNKKNDFLNHIFIRN